MGVGVGVGGGCQPLMIRINDGSFLMCPKHGQSCSTKLITLFGD